MAFAPVGVAPSQMITSSIASQSLLGVFSSSAQVNSAIFVKDGAAAKTNDPPIDCSDFRYGAVVLPRPLV